MTAVVGLFVLLSSGLPVQNTIDSIPRWQHLALPHDLQSDPPPSKQINKLGNEGWELIDVENIHKGGTTKKTVYYFKKAL